jgi:hypothetical protein
VQEYVKVIRLNGDLEPLYGVGLDVLDALTDLARALEHDGIEVDIFLFPAGS